VITPVLVDASMYVSAVLNQGWNKKDLAVYNTWTWIKS